MSSQKFIGRNRAPRVQIEYDVELYGAQKKIQLPFVMGVMADLSGNPTEPLPQASEAASEDIPAAEATLAAPAPPPARNAAFQQLREQLAAPQSSDYYLAWTWCSACCPQGPDYCGQIGVAEGSSPDEAGYGAAQMCVANGGYADTCSANVQYLSASDLAELGY